MLLGLGLGLELGLGLGLGFGACSAGVRRQTFGREGWGGRWHGRQPAGLDRRGVHLRFRGFVIQKAHQDFEHRDASLLLHIVPEHSADHVRCRMAPALSSLLELWLWCSCGGTGRGRAARTLNCTNKSRSTALAHTLCPRACAATDRHPKKHAT